MNSVMSNNITLSYSIAICFLLQLLGHIYIKANSVQVFVMLLFRDFLPALLDWPYNIFSYLLFLKKKYFIARKEGA